MMKNQLIRHQILVQRLANSHYDAMVPFIENAIFRATMRLSGKKYLSPAEGNVLQRELESIFERMNIVTMQNLDDFALYESEFIARIMQGARPSSSKVTLGLRVRRMGIGLDSGKRGKSVIVALKQFGTRRSQNIVKKARQLAIQQLSQDEIQKQLLQLTRTFKAQAKSLAITLTNHTASVARDLVYKENKKSIQYLEWSSILDEGTTDYCRSHNGNRYVVGEGPRPPAHFRCRSIMVAV
jgi:SPP1 gp7 family putative phage head morphogenesis protein